MFYCEPSAFTAAHVQSHRLSILVKIVSFAQKLQNTYMLLTYTEVMCCRIKNKELIRVTSNVYGCWCSIQLFSHYYRQSSCGIFIVNGAITS